jgi:DNA-binding MurR/RpiR family transcriptional regulator
MTAATAPDAMLMRFQPTDTATKVSRATLTRLAKQLGYKRESEVLHYAVRKLADEVLPTYEPDDGPLTAKQMAVIRKAAGPASGGKVASSLF